MDISEGFSCYDIKGRGVNQFVFNDNGTVSGLISTGSTENYDVKTPISKGCCEAMGLTWEPTTSSCYWSETCETNPEFKVTLGAQENAGAIFEVNDNETCQLEVKFNYLLQFDCDSITNCLNNNSGDDEYNNIVDQINDLNNQIDHLNDEIEDLEEEKSISEDLWNDKIDGSGDLSGGVDFEINDDDEGIGDTNEDPNDVGGNVGFEPIDDDEGIGDTNEDPNNSGGGVGFEPIDNSGGIGGDTEGSNNLGGLGFSTLGTGGGTEESSGDEVVNPEPGVDEGVSPEPGGDKEGDLSNYDEMISDLNDLISDLQDDIDYLNNLLKEIEDGNTNIGMTCLSIFENINIDTTLDKVIDRDIGDGDITTYETNKTLETVHTSKLFEIENIIDLFKNNCNTGLYLTGSKECKNQINQCLTNALGNDCDVLSGCTLNSDWLTHKFEINDEETLEKIIDEELKIGFTIKNHECDLNILVDNIEINKKCSEIGGESMYVTKCPEFELEKVVDNKKSWVVNEDEETREYHSKNRETGYDIGHNKLAINTKEIDLNTSPANAIETDVWCYIKDNPSILECSTGQTIMTINTDINFEDILNNEIEKCNPLFDNTCDISSVWTFSSKTGCDGINDTGINETFTGNTSGQTPTKIDYENYIQSVATALGFDYNIYNNKIVIKGGGACDDNGNNIYNNLSIDLSLDLNIECVGKEDYKLFEDGEEFLFEDGDIYKFN